MDKQDYTPKALSGNTNHAIGDVIAAAQVLETIYCAEIDALKTPDASSFIALQSSKIKAAQNYYSVMTQMIERKNELGNIDAATKKKLHEMHARFSNTTQENLEMIKRMKRYTERMGETLRDAAVRAAQKNNKLCYSKNGEMSGACPNKIISSGLCETV